MTTTPKCSRLAPARRREQILEAANALFSERGYDEVSIEEIASSAGVTTRGLVHHYFGGRKEVYIALLVRGVVTELVRRAVALVAARHADIADDSPRLRYALECWTGLNRSATRRWLQREATREQTHELIASTLEHVLRTFGTPPKPTRRTPVPETRTVKFHARQAARRAG